MNRRMVTIVIELKYVREADVRDEDTVTEVARAMGLRSLDGVFNEYMTPCEHVTLPLGGVVTVSSENLE